MPRNYRQKAAYKHALKTGEKANNAQRKVREIGAKFQAVNDAKRNLTPDEIHTHARQKTYPIKTFEELLTRPVPWCASTADVENVYFFVDYCVQALKIMQIIIETLSTKGLKQQQEYLAEQVKQGDVSGSTLKVLSADEHGMLNNLRAAWLEHLKTNLYTLWTPPPSSGGATSRYSIAVQLWLLITHANVILQRANAADKLFDFNPSMSEYLLRNELVIDTSPVMCYTMRTLIIAVDKFIFELECIDRFHADYIAYAVALEHRISEFIAEVGSSEEFDALEWCVSHGARAVEEAKKAAKDDFVTARKKTKDKVGGASTKQNALKEGEEQCSDEFVLSSMVWMLTIYRFAECWFKLGVREMHDGRRQHTRVPWHVTAKSKWVPSSRSVQALSQLMLRYAKGLNARVYETHMRAHIIQFEIRPSDMDIVRLMNKHNQTYLRSVLEYEFKGRSAVANAYVRRVKYDRHVYPYIAEIYQWESGDDETTTSGSLARQSFMRQTSFFFLWDLLIMARFRFPFKARIGPLQHRDVGFVENFEKGRILGVPLIIWNFSRPCVFVPHRRRPELDYESIRRWRANSRRLLAHYGHKSGLEIDPAIDDLTTAMGDLRVAQEAQRHGNAVEPGDVADVDPANQAAHVINPQIESGILRDLQTQQYNRVYDCPDAVTAIAVWAQFLLEINNGVIVETDMRQFLLDAFEWIKP